MAFAEQGITELSKHVDSLITIERQAAESAGPWYLPARRVRRG